MSNEQEAFEQALVEKPNDIAAHTAYADWLMEQGNPWGEFIQVQLALEDESLNTDERKKLKARETELLKAHVGQRVGKWAARALDQNHLLEQCQFQRGWLSSFEINWKLWECLWESGEDEDPEWEPDEAFRLLKHLSIQYYDFDEEIEALSLSPFLVNVQFLEFGNEMESQYIDDFVPQLVSTLPRLRHLFLGIRNLETDEILALPSLSTVQTLSLYHCREYELESLQSNSALANVTELELVPHADGFFTLDDLKCITCSPHLKNLTKLTMHCLDAGDDACRELIDSGMLGRLRSLDLSHGCITDEGARLLNESEQAQTLEHLDLSANAIQQERLSRLKFLPLLNSQHAVDDDRYLYHGDYE